MKAFLFLLTLALLLAAREAHTVQYKVMLSLFGKVGEANITVAERGDEYVMIVEDYATGLAAHISGNERDRFVSRGRIKNGFYISDTFTLFQTNTKTTETNRYVFDHTAKTVTRIQDKNTTVTDRSFDALSMRFVQTRRLKREQKTTALDFYSPFDALSITLNFPKLLARGGRIEVKPVGLAKKDRQMYIRKPTVQELPEMLESFHYPGIISVIELSDLEVKSDDEYGVLLGYNRHGGIDEVVTKETYFLIGYGRIEKIAEFQSEADDYFSTSSIKP